MKLLDKINIFKWIRVSTILTLFCGVLSLGCLTIDHKQKVDRVSADYTTYQTDPDDVWDGDEMYNKNNPNYRIEGYHSRLADYQLQYNNQSMRNGFFFEYEYFIDLTYESNLSITFDINIRLVSRTYFDGSTPILETLNSQWVSFTGNTGANVTPYGVILYPNGFDRDNDYFYVQFKATFYDDSYTGIQYLNWININKVPYQMLSPYGSNQYGYEVVKFPYPNFDEVAYKYYDNGYSVGYSTGYTAGGEGYQSAYDDGYGDGWQNAMDENFEQQYNNGYSVGYQTAREERDAWWTDWSEVIADTARTNGYNSGYNAGLQSAEENYQDYYDDGYEDGYTDGFQADSAVTSIFSGILQVALVPINFFLAIFNFEILGINLSGFIRALFTVAITIIIIKTIFGGKGASE